jgi:hypothetical protein
VDSLPPTTRVAVEVRGKTPRPATSVASYSLAEFKRIRSVAQQTVNEVELRIRAGVGLLRRWSDGHLPEGSDEWRLGNLLHQVSSTGDLPRYPCGKFTEEVQTVLRSVPDGFLGLLRMLYPAPGELGAMTTLLICEQGWNLSVLEEMDIPDQRPDGDVGEVPIHRVEVVKWRRPRSNRFASNNLVDLGPGSAGRAMRQVLAITAHARECMNAQGIDTRRLLVARCLVKNGRNRLAWTIGAPPHCVDEWTNTLDLSGGQDQAPLVISPRRLRRSHQALYGGTRQNTQRTHEDVYLLRDEQVRAEAVDTVAQGFHDALDHATATVRMRMVSAPSAGQGTQRSIGYTDVPADRVDDLNAGRLDTATGACLDFEHSPFTLAGPCSVSFLLCFGCGNAVAVPRHLPRIIYLHEAMTALRSAVSPAAWNLDWAQHHARVGDLLDTHTSPTERGQLRLQLTEPDRRLVDQMLQRRLDT